MTSYHSTERRGRSERRHDDRYDDRYDGRDDDRYSYGYDTYDDYGHGRGDYTAVERYHSRPAQRSKNSGRHSHSQASSSSSSSQRSSSANRELTHVVTSALAAGAVEAFRLRKTPGKWASGAKGGRVATAAIGAAVADTAVERNNHSGKHGRRHVVEATMAGLLADRLLNGSRKK